MPPSQSTPLLPARPAHLAAALALALAAPLAAACGGASLRATGRVHTEPEVVVSDRFPTVEVALTPNTGAAAAAGMQRVNFAIPLAPGQLRDLDRVRVLDGKLELRAARRELARHPDGSLRSIQIQVDTDVPAPTAAGASKLLRVRIGERTETPPLALAAVSTTLVEPDGSLGPRVWARLPAPWLAASGVAGPLVPEARTSGAVRIGLAKACDYENHALAAFVPAASRKDAWLYDRGTVMYRGYARRGDFLTLETAYRETALYRSGLSGAGEELRIGVPESAKDLKYHYTQALAIHYLLTGDDRFRESAEALAERVAALWPDPAYAGGRDFWTERHAGFSLLAYVWAGIVTDDRAERLRELADAAVDAYLAVQRTYPTGWTDEDARCFAHRAEAHGESYGTWGCSPWMSAILADALDAYATERGGERAAAARDSIVRLGRLLAKEGRDPATGRPWYWIGLGAAADEVDEYDEHLGDVGYAIAMAWHHGGRREPALRRAAAELFDALAAKGTSPHLRSFNWQCRSAVAAPYYLRAERER